MPLLLTNGLQLKLNDVVYSNDGFWYTEAFLFLDLSTYYINHSRKSSEKKQMNISKIEQGVLMVVLFSGIVNTI
jgi:hypothetical protein